MLNKLYSRGLIVCAHDILMAAVSFVLSVYLRIGLSGFEINPREWVFATLMFTLICACVFWSSGLYRGVWRYASLNDLWAITKAVTTATLIFAFVMFIWVRLEPLPRSVLLINWFVLMALLGGPRFFYRLLKDRHFSLSNGKDTGGVPVMLVGAGDGAELFIRSLRQTASSGYEVVGIVAEDTRRVGREIHGVEVLGTTDHIGIIAETLRSKGKAPQRLILTKDDMDGSEVRNLLNSANTLGMTMARLPKVTDFRSGDSNPLETTPINVADLLGRPQVPLDLGSMERLIKGRCVMVTGAGGSIGAELVRQICNFGPEKIVLSDNSEFALYSVDLQVSEASPDILRWPEYLDVRHAKRVERCISQHQPDLVFHAAALKHVPIAEGNILEAVDTNVIGTANVAEACHRQGVGVMVLVSTDKAVNPTSIMGATKRVAESFCQALDMSTNYGKTRYVTVRFGNVLGSTGSVVPLFQRQLANGGPLTVTHKDMTRYFMTVREAVELVLQSSALAAGMTAGASKIPRGNICVLDMGEPVRIYDLAEQMIRLAGLVPGKNIKIDIIGTRPGEKLYEEVFHGGEPLVPTDCEGILLAAPRTADINVLRNGVKALNVQCAEFDENRVIDTLHELVPEFASGRIDGQPSVLV